jgi:hypothetical protein
MSDMSHDKSVFSYRTDSAVYVLIIKSPHRTDHKSEVFHLRPESPHQVSPTGQVGDVRESTLPISHQYSSLLW